MKTWNDKVINEIVGIVSPLISETEHSQFSREQVASMLVSASLQRTSIEFASKEPNGDTVFLRLTAGLTAGRLRDAVIRSRPRIRGPVTIAVDAHDVMYYGRKTQGIVGTEEKAGSFYAFKYLVAKVVSSNRVYVVDLREMTTGSVTNPTIEMLEELNDLYDISCVLMDGEFPSSTLIAYLNEKKMSFVCRFRSTATLRNASIAYDTPISYSTVRKRREKRPETLQTDFFIYRYRGRKTDYYLASNMKRSAKLIREEFRSRWGIETGFRDINRVKIKTCTRNFLVRIFIYFLACLLYNLWIKIRSSLPIRLDHLRMRLLHRLRRVLLRAHRSARFRWL